jgi:hypothetical protein
MTHHERLARLEAAATPSGRTCAVCRDWPDRALQLAEPHTRTQLPFPGPCPICGWQPEVAQIAEANFFALAGVGMPPGLPPAWEWTDQQFAAVLGQRTYRHPMTWTAAELAAFNSLGDAA